MPYQLKTSPHNFLIVEGIDKYKKGILFPFNITFDEGEISLPFAMHVLNEIRDNSALLNNVKIMSYFGENKEFAILAFDCKDIMETTHPEVPLVDNVVYKGKIIAKTKRSTIISVNGFYGYTNEATDKELEESINVTVTRNTENKLSFCKLCIHNGETSNMNRVNYTHSEEIDEFLDKEELAALKEDQKEAIEWVLHNIEGTTRKNINVVKEILHLTYNPMHQSELVSFLSKNPQYFDENNFWMGAYRDKSSNDVKLIIYDSQDVVIEVQVNESGMWIQEFSHDRIKSNAQFLMNSNLKALVIAGSSIKFHDSSYHSEDNVEKGEKILNQLHVAKEILFDLKKEIKSLKEKAGIEYLILKEYLSYQESKEREYYKSNAVHIFENQAQITTATTSDRTALFLEYIPELTKLYTEEDEDICHIEIRRDDKPINAILKTYPEKDGYIIEFFNEHTDIEGLKKSGFDIRRRAGIRHLLLQKDSIKDFLYSEGESDIFSKLITGQLISPEPDENIQFFDSKFSNVEAGNNQPLAIRKAVNNKDIFLIQGPPGTGKTSVIVEIIKQLVIYRNERVLVCSQAHSAVKNIYDRLVNSEEKIRIGFLDDEETMKPDSLEEHSKFLMNNILLLNKLEKCNEEEEIQKLYNSFEYKCSTKEIFKMEHKHIIDYFQAEKLGDASEWTCILSDLRKGLTEVEKNAAEFNNARHFQGLNVVMGTCIGIGLNTALQKSGIKFDTVIIDEAGKANLSETTVPMQLGRKYILVGDNKQLPPYMDVQEIEAFIRNEQNNTLNLKEVQNAISSSLFEDFLNDSHFPKESTIQLNYQYRMNPEIGNYISELFYKKTLKNGCGTEKQVCKLRSFPSAVTFIDTSSTDREKAYEKGSAKEGWYNPEEVTIFRERMLPRLKETVTENTNISIGIITPYRKQRELLQKEVKGTLLEDCIYTIDSIQGSEFDIVVLSLVRSFNTRYGNRTVGFLDDMRRLNVALSRAKKKLIIIGNLNTLCDERAHDKKGSNLDIEPVEVFKKLRLIQDRTAEKTSWDKLMTLMNENHLKVGDLLTDCTWEWDGDDNITDKVYIHIELDGSTHTFPMKADAAFRHYGVHQDRINVSFLGLASNDRAHFQYNPDVSIAELVEDGILTSVNARFVEWTDDVEKKEALFNFEDDSETCLKIFGKIAKEHIIFALLESQYVEYIPLYIDPDMGTVSLDQKPYIRFQEKYKVGEYVKVKVIDSTYSTKYYIVKCDNIYGKVQKSHSPKLSQGQEVDATIYNICKQTINFNISKR